MTRIQRPHSVRTILLALLLMTPLPALVRPQPASAAGVVSECTETALRAALAGGGAVTFSCSGTITLTSQLEISTNTIIDGNGQITLDGRDATRLIQVAAGVALELVGLTLANGSLSLSGGDAGAIYNSGTVGILSSTVTGSSALNSGAILNAGGATMVISGSTISGNGASFGGAITNSGNLTIIASTVTGNRARFAGAIDNLLEGTATISTSTLSGNSADDQGGAIFNDGQLFVNASTLAGNTAPQGGGTIYNNVGAVRLTANILSGSNICGGPNIINSNGYNVASDSTCNLPSSAGDVQNVNPLLGPLANNGGATLSMLPQPSSPALGRVSNDICVNLSVATNGYDQRGAPRPRGSGLPCDSGSVEAGSTAAVQVHAVHASPSALDEGGHATITASASGPAAAELQYIFGCPDGEVGPQASPTAECFFAEPGEFEVPVTVSAAALPDNSDDESATVTVRNLPPVIEHVSVSQDRSLLMLHVEAADPGGGALTYRVDCAGNVIGPQVHPQAMCDFGSQTGELLVLVEVSDSQEASAVHTLQVEIPASVCGWRVQRPAAQPGLSSWVCLP